MYNYKLKLIILILICFGYNLDAQILYVKSVNNTQNEYPLVYPTTLVFDAHNMLVSQSNGGSDSYTLSDIRYLNFKDLQIGIIDSKKTKSKLTVYPNPVETVLNIQLTEETFKGLTIELISIEGRVVLKKELSGSCLLTKIDVSYLPKGIYICKFYNGTDIETIKIIKQ